MTNATRCSSGGNDGVDRLGESNGADGRESDTTPAPQHRAIAGPLSELMDGAQPRRHASVRDTPVDPVAGTPFVVDRAARTITKFGQPCLVARPNRGKPRALTPQEFQAAELLIGNIGQYVSLDMLSSLVGRNDRALRRVLDNIREALDLGSIKNPLATLILMPNGSPVRGYGIFAPAPGATIAGANAAMRGTREALLADLGDDVQTVATDAQHDDATLVVRIDNQTVRLRACRIVGRAQTKFNATATLALPAANKDEVQHDVLIGWDSTRGVYAIRRAGRPVVIGSAVLDEAQAEGIAYKLDPSRDAPDGVFTVDSTWAAQPVELITALKNFLTHERSQTADIPTNISLQRDMQILILERLGATRHGLPGLNPLPVYDLPAPYPANALLYVSTISQHGRRGFGILPTLAGRGQALVTRFHRRENMATFIFGLYQYDDTMLVAAWDPDSRSETKKNQILLTVSEDTLRKAKEQNRAVEELRNIGMGRFEEIFVAPLEHLDALIDMRLRPNPQQRMIEALGGNPRLKERLNEHSWTIKIAGHVFHVQWCGGLFRGETSSHIEPFSIAERFVAPQPDALVVYAGYDVKTNVVVLWQQAHDAPVHDQMEFPVANNILEEALSAGFAEDSELIGTERVRFRTAVAARCENDALMAAFHRLSQPRERAQVWRASGPSGIHDELQAYLHPTEWTDAERTRIHPWAIAVNLPTLGETLLDVFAYRAKTYWERIESIPLVIRPQIQRDDERPSFFSAGREPVLLGAWNGIYILFDPRAHPRVMRKQSITVALPRRLLPRIRKKGTAQITRPIGIGEIEETIIFATGEHLLHALDLRLKTLPKINLDRARRAIDLHDREAVNDMVERLQHALDLPERHALTGTRDMPPAMLIATDPPEGIALIETDDALRQVSQMPGSSTPDHLLWLREDESNRMVLLDLRLRAVLQADQAPRWPSPSQFDVLWALTHAAVHGEPVADDVIQSACERSLEWLFVGTRAPFIVHREACGTYRVRLNDARREATSATPMHRTILDRVLNHPTLYAAPRARPDIVWAFSKRIGRERVLPAGSGDDLVFELDGRRVWVYGLTRVLRRSEDGQTDYIVPELSKTQLDRLRLHAGDHHVFAAFDPAQGGYGWVFWSARPHVDRLGDPGYRLHISAVRPDHAAEEWREMEDGSEERVTFYRAKPQRGSVITLLKRTVAALARSQHLALLQTHASEHGLPFDQVLGVMRPVDQMALAMRYGFAPYTRRYARQEIEEVLGTVARNSHEQFRRAIKRARASIDAGEAIPSLADVIELLRDERAEHYMGSAILLDMLRQLYGLNDDARPALLADVFGGHQFGLGLWHALYRELVMRLMRGRAQHAADTGKPPATDALIEARVPSDVPRSEPAAPGMATPTPTVSVDRDSLLPNLVLPDAEALHASYQIAIANLERERDAAWPGDVALPSALARLPADVELVMRAWLGIWPFGQRHTTQAVAAQFDIASPDICRSLIRRASDELLAHAQSMRGIVLDEEVTRPTLESLAALITKQSERLDDDELGAVLARHGLAGAQLTVSKTTRQGGLREFRPPPRYRVALDKLTGEFDKWETLRQKASERSLSAEQIDDIYKRIDAGEYARILLLLRDPATRDKTFSDMVLRSVAAAGKRKLHRQAAMRGIRMGKGRRNDDGLRRLPSTTLSYETSVTRVWGIDPRIETFEQRAQLLDAVLERALVITDQEAESMKAIIKEGEQAFDAFYERSIGLAYHAASAMGYSKDRPETHGALDDAMVALRRAIEGYMPRMSTSFSLYAMSVIEPAIFRGWCRRYARRLNISTNRARDVIMTRSLRARLRHKAAMQNLQREPTREELARAVMKPTLLDRLRRKLDAEPTASQTEAGWREYMPEFLRRIDDILEVLADEDQARIAISLDQSAFADGGRTLHEHVAAPGQPEPSFPGDKADDLDDSSLATNLQKAFDSVRLTEAEQDMLKHRFGIAGYTQLPIEQLAQRRGVSEKTVSRTITSALSKISESQEAEKLLTDYLRR